MASASVSFTQKRFKYDVFVSFRGEDTRNNFVDHLYHALLSKGIKTYKDDRFITKGERIDDQLARSIEESRLFIIVFSKNYANSSCCLDELVKIMECRGMKEHTAYTIFYDVEPSEVRQQRGAVKEAFAKHEKKEDAGKWRDALTEAAGLAGWQLKTTFDGHGAEFIQKVVGDISLQLNYIDFSVDEKLVGMETRVKNIVSSLNIGINDVRMIGIKGIRGGGKTTLARAVFYHLDRLFEGRSFVENVKDSSLKELQKKVLSDVLNIDVKNEGDGKNMMKKMMGSRKVLVVLDDVDDVEQLEALAGRNWFKPGSRIIITAEDEQALIAHRIPSDDIYDVKLLSDEEAICLFSRYAFGSAAPDQGYADLSGEVVNYADGLPLTIKVLGSFLCGKNELEWVEAIKRLKTSPLKKTIERLELSYTGLETDEKEIFLDIACILKGERKDEAIRILKSCGFHAEIGLDILVKKSLVTISNDGRLLLHNQIEEMGRDLVRRLHPDEPNRHSRLWIKEEIEDILVNESGTEATRSLKLLNTDLSPDLIMNGLRNMTRLRFIYVGSGAETVEYTLPSSYGNASLPNALQYIYWRNYPLCCLPTTFQANNLVNLEMVESNISEIWEGGEKKVLYKLRFIDLTFSRLKTFDLGLTPCLESLKLGGCTDFVELHIPVQCSKLKYLSLSYSKLSSLNLSPTPNLVTLDLSRCKELVELYMPVECPNLQYLNLSGSKLSKLDLRLASCLEELNLEDCNDFVELHMPVQCSKLKYINLSGSKLSRLDLRRALCLEELNLQDCNDFVELHMPVQCSKLKYLKLSGSKLSRLDVRRASCLEELNLQDCNDFVGLHMPVQCSKLKYLNLSGSKLSRLDLREAPCLEELNLKDCNDFVGLHMRGNYPNLRYFNLSGSKLSDHNLQLTSQLQKLESLEKLTLSIKDITHLPDSICKLTHLKSLELKSCFLLEHLPKDIGRLECLEKLHLSDCISLRDVPNSICNIKCLKNLHLPYSVLVEKLPDELGRLECLEELNIEGTGIKHLPQSIFQLKDLCIVWSKGRLESHGFTSLIKLSRYTASCYIKNKKELTTVSSKG